MAQSLSNITVSLPISSRKIRSNSISSLPHKFSNLANRGFCIKAMAGDQLQRQNRAQPQTQQQQVPKKRVAQVAPIGLWDRFPTARTVQQMMDTMERIMDDPFVYSGGNDWRQRAAETGGNSRGRTPWEIMEGEKGYKMRFDIPGMTKNDVKLYVEEKMLVVKAEKAVAVSKAADESGGDSGRGEESEEEWAAKSFGKYSWRIALPENVEFEKIRAEVKDGVLYINIPKASKSSKVFDINVQ